MVLGDKVRAAAVDQRIPERIPGIPTCALLAASEIPDVSSEALSAAGRFWTPTPD